MASQVTNYQCPGCTAPLRFSPEQGKVVCDYCESTYDASEIEALYREKDARAAEAQPESHWEPAGAGQRWEADMRGYNCPSCGAELICDENTAATCCPYCGNPAIIAGKVGGGLKPDYVIPFALDKAAAVTALKNHYKGKFLLPRAFSRENQVEKVQGVYVPFWLLDGQVEADLTFAAQRVHVVTRGDERITTTEHFRVRRCGTIPFTKVPVDASSKMPDDYMDAVEPYDYRALQPFSNAYLPGYLADKFDVPLEECAKRVNTRMENTAVEALEETVLGYSSRILTGKRVCTRRGRVAYAMMPVWLLSTRWKDRNYLFAMNGQTGKIVGDLPMDQGRLWATFGAIAGGLAAVLALLTMVL